MFKTNLERQFDSFLSFATRQLPYLLITFLCSISMNVQAATINVSNSQQLIDALKNASPGDEIVLASGTYTTTASTYYYPLASYYSGIDSDIASRTAYFRGTQNNITLRSSNPSNPAVLAGADWNADGYVLHVTGSNWTIKDLKIRTGAKGLILDNSSNSLIQNVEIYDIGQEGLHIRDHSHDCVVDNIFIHDVGKKNDGFGEGIYIGSDNSVWWEGNGSDTGEKGKRYRRACHNTLVKNSTFGPNITAEPVEIKEGSENTIVENCIIRGTGISGSNFADSHLDIKGTYTKIRNNTFYQDGNGTIDQSIMIVPRQSAGVAQQYTAHDNYIYGNTFELSSSGVEVAVANNGSEDIYAWNNTRIPSSGNYYNSRVNDFEPSVIKNGTGAKGSSCHIATPERGYEVAGESGSFTFEIITEEGFTVSTDQSWMTASRSGNTITVTYNANSSGNTRSGRVNINGCLDTYVTIDQTTGSGPVCTLELNSSTVSFTESAGSVNIAVTTSETFSVSDNQSWITASKSGDNVVINVTENTGSTERSGTVTVSGCETKTISVTQSGTATTCSLSVSSSSLSFSDAAGNNTVNVTSTESFTASSSQSWISTSISGNVITVSVSANSSSSARNGSVVVNGCQSKTISVAQSAGSSSGGGSTITVTDDAYVREDKPNNNYGSATSVRTEKISSEDQEGYLKFNLSGLSSSSINVAKLRVYPYSGRGVNNSLHVGNSNSWSESNITWSNKPSYGSTIATWYINDDDQYFYIDITSQVKSNAGGNLTLVITGASQDDIRYRSKESGNNAAVILINDDASNTRQLNSSISLNGDLEEELMNIYPNPISSSILKIVGTVEPILIFNIQGEKLIETTSKSIDVSELSPGFYIVRSGNQVKKLIKK
ncbi:DNRLRE domain-containing protein [Flammeovirga yaeyamensis]|uniref:DNRLRE domain-containing protein n=1 Tax=Flammeovirga yaeyamensis TaxID=367791 RepID=A0AAX1N2C8_9BACT|nr:DNRLRE domain-containing protein [Flammeovirga yaeyamensis]MBB3700743.1 hypothetical protein [Flammeovirga yaeyamensis]NMF37901.1 DNRLRE domain-containing protein [Flammeovirga yaeyamensis]QWG01738.1 DNRLRE domain-containing protein [Flammeovirga yaeyamensis]